ncbi:hypothetical protein HAX54_005687 [Datura stramonium]|uniref:Uncharacterized protein n=1 Tax=Datura stramonium TaxID=4076 RepID=A0ABS8T9Z1_DATST|nr:hypothetical protein [Datura stramonium]
MLYHAKLHDRRRATLCIQCRSTQAGAFPCDACMRELGSSCARRLRPRQPACMAPCVPCPSSKIPRNQFQNTCMIAPFHGVQAVQQEAWQEGGPSMTKICNL